MNEEIYQKNSDYFLIVRKTFRQLKQQGKLDKNQIKNIEKKIRVMSYWLLLNTQKNKNNKIILNHRLTLCLRDRDNPYIRR